MRMALFTGMRRGELFKLQWSDIDAIKEAAGITADLRALHGLRHVYASMLASSGEVDMYALQILLTNKLQIITQRYVNLRD